MAPERTSSNQRATAGELSTTSGGHFPDVSMVESADSRQRFQFRTGGLRCHGPCEWCVLIESEMSAVLVVVIDELAAQATDVRHIDCDHIVEAFSASGTGPAFRGSVLPGTPDARPHRSDGGGFQ
jgi:hypothetical protein